MQLMKDMSFGRLKIMQLMITYSVANTILEELDSVSHITLHQLLYFAYWIYLEEEGDELFPSEIQAWKHSPIIPDVYKEYKNFGGMRLSDNTQIVLMPTSKFDGTLYAPVLCKTDKKERKVINRVINKYEGIEKVPNTPWFDAYEKDKNNRITNEHFLKYKCPLKKSLFGRLKIMI